MCLLPEDPCTTYLNTNNFHKCSPRGPRDTRGGTPLDICFCLGTQNIHRRSLPTNLPICKWDIRKTKNTTLWKTMHIRYCQQSDAAHTCGHYQETKICRTHTNWYWHIRRTEHEVYLESCALLVWLQYTANGSDSRQHIETYNPPHSADHAQYALMTSYEQLRKIDPPTGWSGDTQHVLTLCWNKISLSTSN